jgi:hypothetical protein
MVQVIENRAEIEGQLVALRDDESRPGHKRITIAVRAVQPVESYPNLLGEVAGKTVELVVPADAARTLEVGSAMRCRARRAGPTTLFAENCSRIGQ